jgi:hypothetical protein
MPSLNILIIDKNSCIKSTTVKDYKEEDLYKKCGFKKKDGFEKQTEWNTKVNGQKYSIVLFAKTCGKSGFENKYDFPPPVDNKLYFGSCALIGYIRDDSNSKTLFNLTIELWKIIYEKLFGGFDNLADTAIEDEEEEDELDLISKSKKTKSGYLKDGFVVDSEDTDENENEYNEYETCSSEITSSDCDNTGEQDENELILQDVGSELSEESYDYSDNE